nr:hypothetical protein [Immundisolibacter cernigliae]
MGHLPGAGRRRPSARQGEEIAVGGAQVIGRCQAATAAQHHLAGHELAVVLADRALGRPVARVRQVGAGGPLPDVAEHLLEAGAGPGRLGFEPVLVQKIAAGRGGDRSGGRLPFELSRQAPAGEAGIGVGFVKAQVTDRRGRIEGTHAAECEHLPAVFALFPVQRGRPAARLHRSPAVRQPQFGRLITARGDEVQVFATGDQAIGQPIRGQENAVARCFVVEGKPRSIVSDLHHAAVA